MKLTKEQAEAISRGEEIPVDVEGTECVLVRKDIYAKISGDVSKGRSDEVTEEDLRRQLVRSCESSDWNDPAMDIYNDYESVITGTKNHAR
ncbi:hypothetical protein [Gimesia sp.]|uniref:hypothetical protein n=1 Tax=Gimesia sp. TaxID=2024833 RepID=UPI000C38B9C3|nr:hypothetical protein [Gimesia sp.]MAX40349.1 hypothetical protein [Gimesia sp.]HAH43754.1 hypothetical protein [Planctomycetaceae bacterium]HBL43180.1 hypothetical protein [Planctomycetaceae bacterium]|tara:strand:- start:3158 stop:3430 length:273 start_codon:yes stop_codon:yes gene_type:complete